MKVEEVDIQINSGIQAINLPAHFKIEDNKVYLKKMGNVIYIIPYHKPWQNVHESLDIFTQDFMEDRNQNIQQTRESF